MCWGHTYDLVLLSLGQSDWILSLYADTSGCPRHRSFFSQLSFLCYFQIVWLFGIQHLQSGIFHCDFFFQLPWNKFPEVFAFLMQKHLSIQVSSLLSAVVFAIIWLSQFLSALLFAMNDSYTPTLVEVCVVFLLILFHFFYFSWHVL